MKIAYNAAVCSLVLAGAWSVTVARPQSVTASCVGFSLAQELATAPVIFVGTVTATRDHGVWAAVRVEEIWKGRHVPRRVTIDGYAGAESRYFQRGVRYLFVPERVTQRSPYADDDCTGTRRYTASLGRYRPRGAHRP
jgi:hypothetical protein